jgi:sporulation protein YlmC with PRC-barrel domain
MESDENKNDRLRELGGSDFEIADHQPDITGWEIFDSLGDYIGDVDDLIFDKVALKVRYIITKLEGYELDEEKMVLIPIGLVTLKEDKDEVLLTEAISSKLAFLPAYEGGKITPLEELQIRDVLIGSAEHVVEVMNYKHDPDDDFYNHTHFNDEGYNRNPPGRDGLEPGRII